MIHYHGTPFGGSAQNQLALASKHAMVSFWRPDIIETVAEICQSFALDNGAFSAWTKGGEIDVPGFMAWAALWLKHPGADFALLPDKIDGTEAENDALLELAPNRFQWCPVWHLHESIERLERLCHEWPCVALGSSGEFKDIGTRRWWDRMCVAMDRITDDEGMPICKLHGLRMLDPGLFSYFPFASADSTNVARNSGNDIRWTGPYVPRTAYTRALVIMDRIERHACAARWHKGFCVKEANFDLLG